jgi:hypothetical protein
MIDISKGFINPISATIGPPISGKKAAKTFKELNATDIGYVLNCRPDFAMAKAQHPKLRLKRTQTLMQGDDCCNHTWYWKE